MPKPAAADCRRVEWVVIGHSACLCLRCGREHVIVELPTTIAAFVRWARSVMAQHAGCKELPPPKVAGQATARGEA